MAAETPRLRAQLGLPSWRGLPLKPVEVLALGGAEPMPVAATLSAGTFGVLPLLAPGPFATIFGLAGTDAWVFRLAGAGCLGYATAGLASVMAAGYRLVRIQNFAAISFNALGAISAWLAVASGNGGWLAPAVALAASFFTVALVWVDRRLAS